MIGIVHVLHLSSAILILLLILSQPVLSEITKTRTGLMIKCVFTLSNLDEYHDTIVTVSTDLCDSLTRNTCHLSSNSACKQQLENCDLLTWRREGTTTVTHFITLSQRFAGEVCCVIPNINRKECESIEEIPTTPTVSISSPTLGNDDRAYEVYDETPIWRTAVAVCIVLLIVVVGIISSIIALSFVCAWCLWWYWVDALCLHVLPNNVAVVSVKDSHDDDNDSDDDNDDDSGGDPGSVALSNHQRDGSRGPDSHPRADNGTQEQREPNQQVAIELGDQAQGGPPPPPVISEAEADSSSVESETSSDIMLEKLVVPPVTGGLRRRRPIGIGHESSLQGVAFPGLTKRSTPVEQESDSAPDEYVFVENFGVPVEGEPESPVKSEDGHDDVEADNLRHASISHCFQVPRQNPKFGHFKELAEQDPPFPMDLELLGESHTSDVYILPNPCVGFSYEHGCEDDDDHQVNTGGLQVSDPNSCGEDDVLVLRNGLFASRERDTDHCGELVINQMSMFDQDDGSSLLVLPLSSTPLSGGFHRTCTYPKKKLPVETPSSPELSEASQSPEGIVTDDTQRYNSILSTPTSVEDTNGMNNNSLNEPIVPKFFEAGQLYKDVAEDSQNPYEIATLPLPKMPALSEPSQSYSVDKDPSFVLYQSDMVLIAKHLNEVIACKQVTVKSLFTDHNRRYFHLSKKMEMTHFCKTPICIENRFELFDRHVMTDVLCGHFRSTSANVAFLLSVFQLKQPLLVPDWQLVVVCLAHFFCQLVITCSIHCFQICSRYKECRTVANYFIN